MKGSKSNPSLDSNTSLQEELELLLLLQEQHNRRLILERERDLNTNRSGSTPPSVEGDLHAAGNLFGNPNFVQLIDRGNTVSGGVLTEEEIRSHPVYLEYYYSNENLNPRLPPPLLSREDWRVAQRFRAAGLGLAVGDSGSTNLPDSSGSSSLFSMRASSSVKAQEDELELRKTALRNISRKNSAELLDKIATGSGSGLKVRRKSFADIVQEGLGQKAAASGLSRTTSQNSIGDAAAESSEATHSEKTFTPSSSAPNVSNARNGDRLTTNIKSVTSDNTPNAPPSSIFEIADVTGSLSGLSMSRGQLHPEDILKLSQMGMLIAHQKNQPQQHYMDKSRAELLVNNINYANLTRNNGSTGDLNKSNSLIREPPPGFTRRASSMTNLQSLLSADSGNIEDPKIRSQDNIFPGTISTGATNDGNLKNSNQAGIHLPVNDPRYIQYIHGSNVPNISENSYQGRPLGIPLDFGNFQALEKAYLKALLLKQIHQYQSELLPKLSTINDYNVKPEFDPSSTSHQGNQTPNILHPTPTPTPTSTSKSPMFKNEKTAQGPSNLRTAQGEATSSQHAQSGSSAKGRFESLLDLVKSNKANSVELSDVLTYVVEFSMDQYGSRFIQQKLESATAEEKAKIFREIIPHARALMTHVFGNFVIQKLFERGTNSQRKELAKHALGHVLPLSLQMYGCRVIQKALEVVGVELQAEMVKELDGSVMKCVRDQNANHVIQKCIECVPQHLIQFIILSFVGHVVTLSMHPYGCRVIQRVLEHCADPKTKKILMDEILGSVCNLAQDQYGNYVIQHVLQHGKPHERSVIISKLAGQIVKMSQQKFASNVVEKCLTVGGPEERKILVNEILGSTDENEPLQAMMKDPFGNYVVQKVLETCDDQNRELILSRIKVHLNALKKYSYAKHIVSRVEKLVAAGEKHVAQSSSSST